MSNKKYKTKFPVSRIKKIMQADEEIGKMTANTPILISAALELFIKSIVLKALEEARAKKAPRIALCHLKRCINNNEKFDFLKDLVENVADPIDNPEEKIVGKAKAETVKVKKSLPTGLGAKYQPKKLSEAESYESESLLNPGSTKFDPIRHIHPSSSSTVKSETGYDFSFKLAKQPELDSQSGFAPILPASSMHDNLRPLQPASIHDNFRPLQPKPLYADQLYQDPTSNRPN